MEAKKKKQQSSGRQSAQYDKIFKENIEAVISSIMQNVLEITAVSMEELPDDIQHTKERKPDTLKKITDEKGNTFVLHIEFQVKNEDEMVYRMLDYYGMLERKYKILVKQFVIFLGSEKPTMPTELDRERLKFSYPLVLLSNLDYRIFLNSIKPEEIILSILANFKGENPENALKHILVRVKETTKGDFSLNRYFNQFRILAQLRNLVPNLKNAMDSIA
jgi:glycerophosphoryl diester phosphodiesterase